MQNCSQTAYVLNKWFYLFDVSFMCTNNQIVLQTRILFLRILCVSKLRNTICSRHDIAEILQNTYKSINTQVVYPQILVIETMASWSQCMGILSQQDYIVRQQFRHYRPPVQGINVHRNVHPCPVIPSLMVSFTATSGIGDSRLVITSMRVMSTSITWPVRSTPL